MIARIILETAVEATEVAESAGEAEAVAAETTADGGDEANRD